ncbi:GMC oxidoreductase [Prosthecobacter vanneervenii]|uniref:Choline dehydrogenase-like flavoprotein n=1 Tax=Prosthecobacter vanneervenii TaxID=48466 RepID=A0A7W7YFK3_9BACT|nr:GMC family oxidoreductase [Prosthecobacter vanneervenii]MBB5035276.1 choline dehydrogenase-like flavoprotein [Prosthecobacter vanneervenii]
MPNITSDKLQDSYDVVIVGSGAGGGQTAYTLTMEGLKVLILEAGRSFDVQTEVAMLQLPSHAPLRGEKTPDKQYGFHDCSINSGWDIPGEPYTNASKAPVDEFRWWRQRMMGGRTNHWGRITLRNGPYDFKPRTRFGLGFDWPISYDDIAPYYDKVEMLIGVFGSNDGLENSPDSSPGVLQPAPKLRVGELYAQKHGKKAGAHIVSIHRAVLTQPQDANTLPAKLHPGNAKAQAILADSMRTRSPCFWATDCHRGCAIRANYDSQTVHLRPALATGNLDILPNAMAREVTLDKKGRASGVTFIDKTTGREGHAKGRAVVLAASSQESVRLLLNSKSSAFPQGLANSSGKVGKYITDSVSSSLSAYIPAFEGMPIHNEDGAGGPHAYVPWTLHAQNAKGQLGFPGGYHLEFTTGRQMPSLNVINGIDSRAGHDGVLFGAKLKEEARRTYGCQMGFGAQGTMLPNDGCFTEIDPELKDQWGIPVLRFHWKWTDFELNQVRHQQQRIREILEAMGGRISAKADNDPAKLIRRGGEVIHEVGGAIMGADREISVTNQWSQTWDVKNLFMADGAPFASTADKNPTLTIMALAWRMADHLMDEMKKGNI